MIQTPEETDAALARLARQLGVQDLSLLRRALTHSSYRNEHPEVSQDNERLEFLGDAILDFIVGDWLYQHFPEMHEGDMTRTRSALVRTEELATFAREIDLNLALRMGRGEEVNGGRQRDALLCGAFEAMIGALYLDRGIEAVRHFMLPFLEKHIDEVLDGHETIDPKSSLQIMAQGMHLGTPFYEILNASGPDHAKIFTAHVMIGDREYGRGQGSSKHQAEEQAALDAIQKLRNR